MAISTTIERLHAGQRIWAAEVIFRLGGLALLGCTWLASRWLRVLELRPPPHQPTALEFFAAALVVASLWSGLALSWLGPGILACQPRPPRPLT